MINMVQKIRDAVVDRFALVWLATVGAACTTYLGASEVLSSDAVAGLLGSVISLAGGFTMRGQLDRRRTTAEG